MDPQWSVDSPHIERVMWKAFLWWRHHAKHEPRASFSGCSLLKLYDNCQPPVDSWNLTPSSSQTYKTSIHVLRVLIPWAWFNIKLLSYQYRKSHCGDKMVIRSSYLHNGNSYTGKKTYLYWISPLIPSLIRDGCCPKFLGIICCLHWEGWIYNLAFKILFIWIYSC